MEKLADFAQKVMVAKGHPNFTLKDITKQDFVILVNMPKFPNQPEFFILRTKEVEKILQKGFEDWIAKLGKKGRPRSKENKHRLLTYKDHKQLLDKRKDWNILWG